MKFIINKERLLETLQKVQGPTTSKQNFPILNSVLISAEARKIKFFSTDLDTTILSFLDVSAEETGKVAVPMRRFLGIVRELPSGEVSVEKLKNTLCIKCGTVVFKINTLDPEEFPKIEEPHEVTLIKIKPQVLDEMISLTSFCVGYEDTNYVLNGILFEVFEQTIQLVSTDGKRLSYVRRELAESQPGLNTKIEFILPVRAVQELHRLIRERENDIYLFVEENRVGFDFKDTQFIARPIEGEFPNYSQYIPAQGKDVLTIDRRQMLSSLRRADLLSTPDYQGVKCALRKDGVVISKNTPQLGEVKETVSGKFTGTPLEIGFNPTYLMDVLKNLTEEEVSFEFYGAEKPTVLRKENFVYLVLPMKI
ncbi:MAG: DNA polymerase III subunit beta [Candidatus Omnitrophica bacterium]|nr:DNA polymerase III subunit beta [Candidatus Omnitrophota bacterium]